MTTTGGERWSAVRQVLLAVTVLDEVDVVPTDAGVQVGLDAAVAPVLDWPVAAAVLAGLDPAAPAARVRLRSWLRQHDLLAVSGPQALRESLRPLALAPDGALHPGRSWSSRRVLGGALDLGLGVLEAATAADATPVASPLWPDVADALGVDEDDRREASGRLAALGDLAGRRLRRRGDGVLAARGGCDAVTLLCSSELRAHLLASPGAGGVGMLGVAVPTRTRGWCAPVAVEPAFTAAAWSATDVEQRGLALPVLVTADEVSLAVRPAR